MTRKYVTRAERESLAAEEARAALVGKSCQYRYVVSGTLHVCGAAGYPYCREHQLLTQPLPAARYSFSTTQR